MSVSYSLKQLFRDLSNGSFNCLSLNLETNGHRIAALQMELHGNNDSNLLDDKAIETLVDSQSFRFHGKKDWTRFNIMVASYLQYCRDVNPWSISESYDVIFIFYSNLINCLLNDSYSIDAMDSVSQENTEYVIPIAIKLDNNYMMLGTRKNQFLSHTSSIISKLFNSIKPSRSLDGETIQASPRFDQLPEKQRILLYLVNKLNNIYFRIRSPQLCSNIFKNFRPKSMVSKFSDYPVKEQIEYRYLLGRYYLLNNKVIDAFAQLNVAFRMLSIVGETLSLSLDGTPQLKRNLLRILKYLVPAGLIIGKLPRFWIIDSIDRELADMYSVVARHVRSGNIKGLNLWLQTHETRLREDHLLLILLEKLPMLTYRYLIRAVVQQWTIPQNTSRIPYQIVEQTLRLSIRADASTVSHTKPTIYNNIHTPDSAENILVTLINLNFLRSNCFPLLKTCVIKKTRDIGEVFPSIDEKIVSMFPLNSEDTWIDL